MDQNDSTSPISHPKRQHLLFHRSRSFLLFTHSPSINSNRMKLSFLHPLSRSLHPLKPSFSLSLQSSDHNRRGPFLSQIRNRPLLSPPPTLSTLFLSYGLNRSPDHPCSHVPLKPSRSLSLSIEAHAALSRSLSFTLTFNRSPSRSLGVPLFASQRLKGLKANSRSRPKSSVLKGSEDMQASRSEIGGSKAQRSAVAESEAQRLIGSEEILSIFV